MRDWSKNMKKYSKIDEASYEADFIDLHGKPDMRLESPELPKIFIIDDTKRDESNVPLD